MPYFDFIDQTKLDLDSEKATRIQVEEALVSLKEENAIKDYNIEVLKVQLEDLEQRVKTLQKMHQDSQDHNMLGMMDRILE